MKSIRTQLSVLDHNMFKLFLEANDMADVFVGNYEERETSYQTNNKICYAYSDTDEKAVASMIYMQLKYGNVEQAYVHYMQTLRNRHTNWDTLL